MRCYMPLCKSSLALPRDAIVDVHVSVNPSGREPVIALPGEIPTAPTIWRVGVRHGRAREDCEASRNSAELPMRCRRL